MTSSFSSLNENAPADAVEMTEPSEHAPDIERTHSYKLAHKFQAASSRIARARKRIRRGKKSEPHQEELDRDIQMDEHTIPLEELVTRLGTDPVKGLTAEKAADLLRQNGPNELTKADNDSLFLLFLAQMTSGFALLLWGGSVLCFVAFFADASKDVSNLYLGIVLAGVVLLNGAFSFYQEFSAAKIMAGFQDLIPVKATVIRDGARQSCHPSEIVVGDLVFVRTGDRIPADIRMTKVNSLAVDNSSLTGESLPQSRSILCTDDNPLETKNLSFYSTNVEKGAGEGIVVATGDKTVIGQLATLMNETEKGEPPIRQEIHEFIKIISIIAMFLGVSFFIIGVVLGTGFLTNLVFAIGIIVANVPEGLLATVTVALTLTAKKMYEQSVLVKSLESVETLGSCSIICSDKTGTLTQNEMAVNHLWFDNVMFTSDTAVTQGSFDKNSPTFQHLFNAAVLCNSCEFLADTLHLDVKYRKGTSDASETALIKFAEVITPIATVREAKPELGTIPFSSTNKWMLTVNETNGGEGPSKPVAYVKGAPERVLNLCTKICIHGEIIPMTDVHRAEFTAAYTRIAQGGERVLGFCFKYLPEGFSYNYNEEMEKFDRSDMVFAGLISLIDPPREAVPHAVKDCISAGIQVVMITGDHALTATAIARDVHIITGKTVQEVALERGDGTDPLSLTPADAPGITVTGAQLDDMDQDDLDKILDFPQIVFARTSPTHKLMIVEGFIRRNNVVAMTGDGVNDSASLVAANLGCAMGSGTDVAKQAGDIILLDDNFASIVVGVREGRTIFDNLKKSIAYTLSSNIPEITPFLTFITLQIPLALSTVHILGIDLGTDMVPAISLSKEEPESTIMQRPPRNPAVDKLVTGRLINFSYLQIGVMQALAGFFAYFTIFANGGFYPGSLLGLAEAIGDPSVDVYLCNGDLIGEGERKKLLRQAQTAFFFSIIVVQWADLLACKTRELSIVQQGMRNTALNLGLIFETVLGISLIYLPGVSDAFGFEAIHPGYLFLGLPFSVLILAYDEARKYVMRNKKWLMWSYY